MPFALAVISLVVVSVAHACNIPVFRYALERWRPDQCEIIVVHDEPLNASQESLISEALPLGQRGGTAGKSATKGELSGARVVRVDWNDPEPAYASLVSNLELSPQDLPVVVVRAPVGPGRTVNAWRGSLDELEDWGVFASPARSEMAQRLLRGHSVVWLMIKSDDEDRNKKARDLLDVEVERLSRSVELPDGIGLPGSELHSEVPLLVKFSVVEVDRNDEREQFLVDLLTGIRSRSVEAGEPLVVPVFGRGRALEVIPASELSPRLMEDLTAFLSGACSCQVKEQNPGFDLLFNVDWNRELFGEGIEPPPETTSGDRRKPQLLTIPPGR